MEKNNQVSKTVRTSKGLREILFEELDLLRSGQVTPSRARSIAVLSSQIQGTVKLEMDFHRYAAGANNNDDKTNDNETTSSIQLKSITL